ncbi:MAG TPA: hypothetical protein VGL58_21355 [Caulobacteraceae bacterium]|jgi:hypothetical protein
MRRLDWLYAAIIAAFLATAAIAQLVLDDTAAPAKVVAPVSPVKHFVSWPEKQRQVKNFCPNQAKRT